MTVSEVINSFTVDGVLDFGGLDKLVSELVSQRATIRKTNKEAVKEAKKASLEELAKAGKEYWDTLEVGAEFDYRMADGTVVHAKKIETKSGSNKSASCEVISGLTLKSDNNKRYPKFSSLVIPTEE